MSLSDRQTILLKVVARGNHAENVAFRSFCVMYDLVDQYECRRKENTRVYDLLNGKLFVLEKMLFDRDLYRQDRRSQFNFVGLSLKDDVQPFFDAFGSEEEFRHFSSAWNVLNR